MTTIGGIGGPGLPAKAGQAAETVGETKRKDSAGIRSAETAPPARAVTETAGAEGVRPQLPPPAGGDPGKAVNMLDGFFAIAVLFHEMANEMSARGLMDVLDSAEARLRLLEGAAEHKKAGADLMYRMAWSSRISSGAATLAGAGGQGTAGLSQGLSGISSAQSGIGQARNQTEQARGDLDTAMAETVRAQQDTAGALSQSFNETALSIRRAAGEILQSVQAARQSIAAKLGV